MTHRRVSVIGVHAAIVSLLVGGAIGNLAYAEEVKLIASAGVRSVVSELSGQFEATTGHKVVTDFAPFANWKRRIDSGETFDIAILSPALIDDYIKQGRIASDTRINFGRAGIGVGIRRGAPKPDIGSVESLKRTLLDAKSIAYSARSNGEPGESGVYFLSLLDRLGIAREMKSKIRGYEVLAMTNSVASGETELVVTSITIIIPAQGLELVGEVPSDVQSYVLFTAGVSAATKSKEVARALLRFMTAPTASNVFKANGMRPG